MAVSFKGAHFPQDIILIGVRWYVAYPLSTRHVEELMLERGVHVDHSTINRWVVKYSPQLEEAFHRRKRPVWISWRMDETYIKVKGQWYSRCPPSKPICYVLGRYGVRGVLCDARCPDNAAWGMAKNSIKFPMRFPTYR